MPKEKELGAQEIRKGIWNKKFPASRGRGMTPYDLKLNEVPKDGKVIRAQKGPRTRENSKENFGKMGIKIANPLGKLPDSGAEMEPNFGNGEKGFRKAHCFRKLRSPQNLE